MGEQLPQPETCNGLDDDCDGIVDDNLTDIGGVCYTGPEGTQDVGICHSGSVTCVDAALVCTGEQLPRPETCNCLDNDCNGIVGDIPPGQPCYDGPAGTQGVGICHGGGVVCGLPPACAPYCANEQLPEPSACGDEYTSCGNQSKGPIDFVFILDDTDSSCASGMGVSELIAAQQTITTFSYQNPQADYHYGLIVMPGCGGSWNPNPTDAGYVVSQNLATEQVFGPTASVQCIVSSTDDPSCALPVFYSLDVLYQQGLGNIIPWDHNAQERYLVMFTGSPGASSSDAGITAQQLQTTFAQHSVTPVIFSDNGNRYTYDQIVGTGPGMDFDVSTSQQMTAEITLALDSTCPDAGL
jgi:hypothetical protein